VKRHLQPIGHFVAAVCLLVTPFALAEGWLRRIRPAAAALRGLRFNVKSWD